MSAVPLVRVPAGPAHDSAAEREAWAVLSSAHGLGPVGFMRLLDAFGSARSVLEIAGGSDGARRLAGELRTRTRGTRPADDEAPDQDSSNSRRLLDAPVLAAIVATALDQDAILGRIDELGLTILTLDDPGFPARLLGLEMPPPVLFVRGAVDQLSAPGCVAVVGTRQPTEAGRWTAGQIAGAITRLGGVVVSGLAVGIDGAAHNAAVSSAGQRSRSSAADTALSIRRPIRSSPTRSSSGVGQSSRSSRRTSPEPMERFLAGTA